MKDGSPELSPVWANYEDGFILVNTAEGRIKHKNIPKLYVASKTLLTSGAIFSRNSA
jgi:hypothetical protein